MRDSYAERNVKCSQIITMLSTIFHVMLGLVANWRSHTLALGIPKVCRRLQIIHIQQIHSSIPENPPYRVPRPHRPARLVPISDSNALPMRRRDLLL